MSSDHLNYADEIRISIITRPSPFGDPWANMENEEIDYNECLVSIQFGLPSKEPQAISDEINRVMYSNEHGLGDHFTIEQRYRREEHGASSVFYDFILTVGSGVISELAFYLITNYKKIKSERSKLNEEDYKRAVNTAKSIVRDNSGISEKYVEVIEMQYESEAYIIRLSDKVTKREYLVVYIDSIGVTEYRLCSKQSDIKNEIEKSLLLRLLLEGTSE